MNYIHSLFFGLSEEQFKFMTKSTDTTKIYEYFEIFDDCVKIANYHLHSPVYILLKTEIYKFIQGNLGRHILEIDPIFRKSLLKELKFYQQQIPYDCHNDMNLFELKCQIDYIYNIMLDIRDYKYYKKYYNE
jgi:hypothetical protein